MMPDKLCSVLVTCARRVIDELEGAFLVLQSSTHKDARWISGVVGLDWNEWPLTVQHAKRVRERLLDEPAQSLKWLKIGGLPTAKRIVGSPGRREPPSNLVA